MENIKKLNEKITPQLNSFVINGKNLMLKWNIQKCFPFIVFLFYFIST